MNTKKILFVMGVLGVILVGALSAALAESKGSVAGGFEMQGFFNGGFGFQKFSSTTTTVVTNGSYAGVMGSVIPAVNTGIVPNGNQNDTQFFVEALEVDVIKSFGERAKLRADILFGRATSSSWVANQLDIEQAYGVFVLWPEHGLELTIGRMGSPIGFEPFEPHDNDTISWSVIGRSGLYPPIVTGGQLSWNMTDHLQIFLAATNGLTTDTTRRANNVPTGYASFKYTWGDEARQSFNILSVYGGPDSGSNGPLTIGVDNTLTWWLTERFRLGLEALFRRDGAATGGVTTKYASALLDLRFNFTETTYGVFKYSMAKQFEPGNGVLNITGAEQLINEFSLAVGHDLADSIRIKGEARVDLVNPTGQRYQYVYGAAMALSAAF